MRTQTVVITGVSGGILRAGGTIIDTSSPLDIEELIGKYVFGEVKKNNKEETK